MLLVVAMVVGEILLYTEILSLIYKSHKNGQQRNRVAEIAFLIISPISVVMLLALFYLPFFLIWLSA